MADLTRRSVIVAKGVLFAVLTVMSGALVVLFEAWWQELPALGICVWAACRFYYFLFHVLERYVGLGGRYAGLLDLLSRLRRGAARKPPGVT